METAFDAEFDYLPLPMFLYDDEVAASGEIDVVRAGERSQPKTLCANLFHRPKILLGGLGGCQDSPSRLESLSDIELFLLVQAAQRAAEQGHVRWHVLEQLTFLKQIYLGTSRVNVNGDELANFRRFKKLQVLCLTGQPIADEHLIHLESLANLQELYLQNTKVTDAGVSRLQAALPNCRIVLGAEPRD